MTRDVNVSDETSERDVNVCIRLRYPAFATAAAQLGAETDTARADLVGTTRRQISRMRQGDPVGGVLIARILRAFRYGPARRGFDDLFEVEAGGSQ